METTRRAIEKLTGGEHLDREEARGVALEMFSGEVPDAVIGGLLVALKANGETGDEIAGFARGMRDVEVKIRPNAPHLVDTCGTGGDGKGTFNISTAAALIAAAAGVSVAKHGNRGVSSGCGSADVLEALGVEIEMAPESVRDCIETVGIGFMFAPGFHPAMKRVMGARKALGIPTIFNILGPLTNPAGARSQVLGVSRPDLAPAIAGVLRDLGAEHAFVLHGLDGMDEFTLTAPTLVYEVTRGSVDRYELTPEAFGFPGCTAGELEGDGPAGNARIIRSVLAGEKGPRLDICLANAGFALRAGGVARNVGEGIDLAKRAVRSGEAAAVLDRLVAFTTNGGRDVPR